MKKIMIAVLLCLIALPVLAETITLKSGKVVEGQIVERNDQLIKLDRGLGVNLTYYLMVNWRLLSFWLKAERM